MRVFWLDQSEKEVPASNDWLCAGETSRLNSLRFAKRRADWRLGRWTAKRAIAACLQWPTHPQVLARIEIRATPSGAPAALVSGFGREVAISLSHRAGVAMCAVSCAGVRLGCDVELIEARSDAFIADYFTSEERALVARAPLPERHALTNLLWSAKECALKALGQGLRLDTRSVVVSPVEGVPDLSGWSPFCVRNVDTEMFHGWWRCTDGILRTLVSDPAPECPIHLSTLQASSGTEDVFGPGLGIEGEIFSMAHS